MTDKKENGWIKFVPSLNLPKERVSIAYDTHDERGVRYAYGYFQFYNGTCGCFWKDGNEQPKVVKAEDIKYWMPVPSLDVQEECNITGIKSKHATGKLKECIDSITDESLAKARKQLQEEPKGCMYSKDNYTDEDRKALCDGCEEECRFNKKEEPVSEELEKVVEEIVDPTVLNAYGVKEIANRLRRTMIEPVSEDLNTVAKEYANNITDKIGYRLQLRRAVCFGANWQKQKNESKVLTEEQCRKIRDDAFELGKDAMKQQMMAKAVDVTVHSDDGGYPYIPQMELYDYDKDIPLAKRGDKYKVILIKED